MQPLLDDLSGTVTACAGWLQLAAPDDALARHAREVGARNAKATAAPYDAQRRAYEAGVVFGQHRDVLIAARDWLAAHVLPAIRPARSG